eukprot:gnl/MRDRNA2_/MRDRNA2_71927_c0_seq1.p1 gnl/MRDRNA2_/MRDRNA2_71927_c0~~gnl/MRDRNA2_/MRDRNA2_71927_c0_seq1.p1  ORF type:complete len:148 (+),score=8.82 gnl/MRDRNA2_/MRDRNA2_71927_c0_seq1:36-479(+)
MSIHPFSHSLVPSFEYWLQRMKESQSKSDCFDFVFSCCLGIYLTATAWLLVGGSLKRLRRESLAKPVLRPALVGGFTWSIALVFYLYAMQEVPYAVSYCSVTGGALATCLLWGLFCFGEAPGAYNRKLVAASFTCMLIGVVMLGMSA